MTQVAVVARGNEVAGARILADTLAEHHPDWGLTVLVLPGVRPQLREGEEPFAVLGPADLAARGEVLPAGAPAELRAALSRPLLVRRLLDDGAERVLVLPPDAEVLGPLDALVADARRGPRPAPARRTCPPTASARTRATCWQRGRSTTRSSGCARARPGVPSSTGGWSARARRRATPPCWPTRRTRRRARAWPRARSAPRCARSRTFTGSRIRRSASPTGTSTSARWAPRGCCAGRAFAPTARGGCRSTRAARSCSTIPS